jgi:hypothetical protein
MSVRIVRRPKPATRKPVTDRVAVPGGAACPRCAAVMQRYKRPEGYKPNAAPFAPVMLWDRCAGCNWITRLGNIGPAAE